MEDTSKYVNSPKQTQLSKLEIYVLYMVHAQGMQADKWADYGIILEREEGSCNCDECDRDPR